MFSMFGGGGNPSGNKNARYLVIGALIGILVLRGVLANETRRSPVANLVVVLALSGAFYWLRFGSKWGKAHLGGWGRRGKVQTPPPPPPSAPGVHLPPPPAGYVAPMDNVAPPMDPSSPLGGFPTTASTPRAVPEPPAPPSPPPATNQGWVGGASVVDPTTGIEAPGPNDHQ